MYLVAGLITTIRRPARFGLQQQTLISMTRNNFLNWAISGYFEYWFFPLTIVIIYFNSFLALFNRILTITMSFNTISTSILASKIRLTNY